MFTAPFGIALLVCCLALVVVGVATAWWRLHHPKRRR